MLLAPDHRLEPRRRCRRRRQSSRPPIADSTARIISGAVMTAGDSCGCASFSQPLVTEERHEHEPGHVERRDACAEERGEPGPPALGERRLDDLVLAPEPGERRDADDRQVADPERHVRDDHDRPERAEAAHVDLVVHAVHDRAGAEEEVGLEEAVGEQVEDRERVAGRTEPGGQHHVADLAHGRPGQGLLDVVLRATDDRTDQQRERTDDDHGGLRRRRRLEDRVRADDEVDAGGDHGRGVDERRHRGRTLHRVEQPRLQRELRRLAAGGEQEHEPDRGDDRAVWRRRRRRTPRRSFVLPNVATMKISAERHADVTDPVHDERLLRRHRRRRLVRTRSRSAGTTRDRRPPSRRTARGSRPPGRAGASPRRRS